MAVAWGEIVENSFQPRSNLGRRLWVIDPDSCKILPMNNGCPSNSIVGRFFSILLDAVAPRATASLTIDWSELGIKHSQFIEDLNKNHKVINKTDECIRFRIDGSFFSDLKATGVLIGNNANPNHYSKFGFYLSVEDLGSMVSMKAEERVILGYLETKAVSKILAKNLDTLVQNVSITGDK